MLTRLQARTNLYHDVLEQPLLLDKITQYLDPNDLVHLKVAGFHHQERFQSTLDHVLQDRHTKQLEQKKNTFHKTLLHFLKVHENLERDLQYRNLNELYDFLLENIWFRHDPYYSKFDRVVERKLIELTIHSEYHNGFAYLHDIYGIDVQAEYSEYYDDMVEYIVDTQGTKHYI
jgi:hypothetical protein